MFTTAFYAGILAIIYVGLTLYVIKGRYLFQVGLGDGGNSEMHKRIRIHGNFAEYVPMGIMLLYLNEVTNASIVFINIWGSVLIASRLLHAYGINKSHFASKQRFFGMIFTFLVLLVCGLRLILVSL